MFNLWGPQYSYLQNGLMIPSLLKGSEGNEGQKGPQPERGLTLTPCLATGYLLSINLLFTYGLLGALPGSSQ